MQMKKSPVAVRTESSAVCDWEFHKSAWNSIKASRWTVLMAKLFGKKKVGVDGNTTVTVYLWRGNYYLTDFTHGR